MVLLLNQKNYLIVFLLTHNVLTKAHSSISLNSYRPLSNRLKKRKRNLQNSNLSNLRKTTQIHIQVILKRVTNGRLLIFNKDS